MLRSPGCWPSAIRTCSATAYVSAHDGLPEPLCAVWEPAAGARVGRSSERRRALPAEIPDDATPPGCSNRTTGSALDNVNTPEEYSTAQGALESSMES